MSILYLSWSVPPSPKASAVLAHNIANNLDSDTVVLVGEKVLGSTLKVKHSNYKLYYVNPFLFNKEKGYQYFRWLYFFPIYHKLKKIIHRENCTEIICAFPNEFYLALGYRLGKKLELPFYPWFHNLYIENMKGYRLLIAKWLQPRVFKAAKKIFTMSEGMNDYLKNKNAGNLEKFIPLKHGFKIPEEVENFSENEIPEKVLFSYTGSFHTSCQDATKRMCHLVIQSPNYELHVFGGSNKRRFIENGIQGKNVIFHGFLSEEDFNRWLSLIHIHLLPHGFEDDKLSQDEIDTIFPTRTVPLLYSGRPILANSPKSSFLTRFLKIKNCAHVVESKNDNELKKGIDLIINDKLFRMGIVKNAIVASREFNISNRTKEIKQIIEKK